MYKTRSLELQYTKVVQEPKVMMLERAQNIFKIYATMKGPFAYYSNFWNACSHKMNLAQVGVTVVCAVYGLLSVQNVSLIANTRNMQLYCVITV